ncbi:MAG: peptidase U32 family protein [Candidatus Electronema sp. V4]|uniref:peptidase U32 family protein n=1 Tax=Candidatus Electronema sp. V4 TaxID=3454756 RepID=UPI0040559693
MELLAPAGSFPAFEAALEAGADAVYVGAPGFNARALSRDFTLAEIDSMIVQARGTNRRLYVAMNSLMKEDELPAALELLSCLEAMRPDALIVQDIGLLHLIKHHFPSLPLHASTLLSVHNSVAAAELTKLGCSRVVLAREMTLEEIAAVHRQTSAELEVFVHGAMCFSYSGLCMFSSLHGGKSSLRGHCVQPCRRRYSWQSGGKDGYLFSMNDLCGLDLLPALRQAGVRCLKIEGRLKTAHYVACVTAAYSLAIACLDKPADICCDSITWAHQLLDEAMGRRRSSGYLLSANPSEAVSPDQSGSSGQLLGQIISWEQEGGPSGKSKISLNLILKEPLNEGDRLRLHDEASGERISFTLRGLLVQGKPQKAAQAGQKVRISLITDTAVAFGRNFQGNLFRVDVGGRIAAERNGRRRSKELSGKEVLPDKKKVERLLRTLAWSSGGLRPVQPAVPAVKSKRQPQRGAAPEPIWWVQLASPSELRERLPVQAQRIVLPLNRESLRQMEKQPKELRRFQQQIIWRLPPVLHEAELVWIQEQLRRLCAAGWPRYALGHCSQHGLFQPLPKGIELYGHYTFNLLNSAALSAAAALPGFCGGLLSLESDSANLAAALSHCRQRSGREQKLSLGLYVYGRPPLFVSRLESKHFRIGGEFVSPKQERFTLERQDGLTVAKAAQPFSLLHRRQDLAALGLDFLFMDLSAGVKKEAQFVSALLGQSGGRRGSKPPEVLTGNFTRKLL